MRKILTILVAFLFAVDLIFSPYLCECVWASGYRVGRDSFGDITEELPDNSLGDFLLWMGIALGISLFIDFMIHHHKTKKDNKDLKEESEENIKNVEF